MRRPTPEQALHWSSFRAARDGLAARIIHRGSLTPLPQVAREVLDELNPGDPALDGVRGILADGNGADRQRAAHARGGMAGLLRFVVEETARPYG